MDFFLKVVNEKTIKQQSKLTFNGNHKFYTIYDSFTFLKKEILMDETIYLGLAVLELSKLLMNETQYDKPQACFEEKTLKLHYMVTDSFVLSINTHIVIKYFMRTSLIILILLNRKNS